MSVDSLMTRLNPLIRFLLRSPLHGLLSRALMLITITGRRSGKRYTIPVGYQRNADVLTVMVSEASGKQWWRNFHEPGRVELSLRGDARTATAVVLRPDSDAFRASANATLRRVPVMRRVFDVDFDPRAGLTDVQVASLGARIAAVEIRLD